ncbi:hypothetical protein SGGMMB4_00582 [Sodalis glossinidius str. 'morsitans']|uniref:Uncharacterized protein n=1 Tax=Sodalis glossinidius (strain morsitans) TaxID=343509 RepID=A0A193QFF1_SODGM|nr:hypothetical protein SGGMMB4_00582 [Sodalis glossinidius str. 'morsitans']
MHNHLAIPEPPRPPTDDGVDNPPLAESPAVSSAATVPLSPTMGSAKRKREARLPPLSPPTTLPKPPVRASHREALPWYKHHDWLSKSPSQSAYCLFRHSETVRKSETETLVTAGIACHHSFSEHQLPYVARQRSNTNRWLLSCWSPLSSLMNKNDKFAENLFYRCSISNIGNFIFSFGNIIYSLSSSSNKIHLL